MNKTTKLILTENLKALKLSTMLRNLDTHIRQAKEVNESYEDFLLNLTESEVQMRRENGRKRRLREAKFPLQKPLETFDIDAATGIDFRKTKELATCDYIGEARNVIFLGKSGTGKTHLATALGMEACSNGISTKFVTGCGIVNELVEARDEKILSRILCRYRNYSLLIIDELGYVPFSKEGSELLFQVLAERHERKSVIITTNIGFADWTKIFGDANLTAALLDRVTHKAHIINCNWESFRLKESIMKRVIGKKVV